MSDCEYEQLRMWLKETESDSKCVLGIKDPNEQEEDFDEENPPREDDNFFEDNDEVRVDSSVNNTTDANLMKQEE